MKTIKFTVSTERPDRSFIKLLKQYKELQSQGVNNVCLVAYNGLRYYEVAWIKIYADSPHSLIKGIESILDGMFLSRFMTYSECHRVDEAIKELWP